MPEGKAVVVVVVVVVVKRCGGWMAEDGGEDAPSGETADSGTHTETHTEVYGEK